LTSVATDRYGPAVKLRGHQLLQGAVALLAFVALQLAQIPRWSFEFDPDTCCCHHAARCPCPGHELPSRESHDSVRSCGSGGHEVVRPAAPVFVVEAVVMPAVIAVAMPLDAPPLAAPHSLPDREEPAAPS